MSTVTIDLGVIDDSWDHVDDDVVGLPRGWGLAAVLALLLSLVSAAPPPGRPHEVTRQPLRNGEFHVVGGALFVLDSDRTPTPVEVFDAADGSLRWTFTPEGLATFSSVVVDVVPAVVDDAQIDGDRAHRHGSIVRGFRPCWAVARRTGRRPRRTRARRRRSSTQGCRTSRRRG